MSNLAERWYLQNQAFAAVVTAAAKTGDKVYVMAAVTAVAVAVALVMVEVAMVTVAVAVVIVEVCLGRLLRVCQ